MNYPFRYVPDERVKRAAEALMARIDSDESLHSIFAEGKMLGVLVCEDSEGRGIGREKEHDRWVRAAGFRYHRG